MNEFLFGILEWINGWVGSYGWAMVVFTVLIRLYANLPEGVSYSILLMNIFTPLIERAVYPKPFGTVREKKGRAAK